MDFENLQFGPVANVVVFLIFILFAASYIIYFMTFLPKKPKDEFEPMLLGDAVKYYDRCKALIEKLRDREYEEVVVKSYDKVKLYGRLYRGEEGAPVDICFHGYNGNSRRDFAGGADIMMRAGHTVLLVDQRGQGRSEGRCPTFGIKERFDTITWIKYAINEFGDDVDIFLVGVSMGAATVLMANDLKLPENLKGIIADCPFNSPYDIIEYVMTKKKHLPSALMLIEDLSAQLFAGFDLRNLSCATAVKGSRIPMLIIHGEGDTYVPEYMSKEIADANPDFIERHTFPDAEHGVSFLYDPERYEKICLDFYDRCLGKGEAEA